LSKEITEFLHIDNFLNLNKQFIEENNDILSLKLNYILPAKSLRFQKF